MINTDQLGIGDYLGRDTISAHPWHRNNEWELGVSDSLWTLKPDPGQVYISTECYIQMSADILITPENAMVIDAYLDNGILAKEVIRFKNFDELLLRSTEVILYEPQNIAEGSSLSGGWYKCIIPFASEVVLWSSAGIIDPGPPLSIQTDNTGAPKLAYMTARIDNHQPYKNGGGVLVETAWSRYFVHIYEDPDYVSE
jgi:hypothetical protein